MENIAKFMHTSFDTGCYIWLMLQSRLEFEPRVSHFKSKALAPRTYFRSSQMNHPLIFF